MTMRDRAPRHGVAWRSFGRASVGLWAALAATSGHTAGVRGTEAVDEAIQAMSASLGAPVVATRSPTTGAVAFLSAPTPGVIPISDSGATTPEARARAFVNQFAKAFGLDADSDLQATKVATTDAVGMDHVRLQQFYRGVPVTGAEMTVHLRGAGIVAVLAKTLPDLSGLEIAPTLNTATAARAAREAVGKATADLLEARNVRLEILNRGLLESGHGVTRLAWFAEVVGDGVREYVWIDARRGVVLLRFSQLTEVKTRQVFSANGGSVLPGHPVRSEGQPATGDPDADAAYEFSGDTYDYFLTQHGRDSFDGAGAPIVSTVHFCPSPQQCPYPNAAWTGSQLIYGEGFSRADDVDAHELTHALTERTANLFYYMQSGALNESISDIFGETVDLTNGKGNDDGSVRWLMGEDVPGAGAIRNLMRPGQFGDPERVGDPAYVCALPDNGGVHTNSGVPNHAYALMVDGGAYNGHTVTGIGLEKAGKIVYRALTSYLTSAANLIDFDQSLRQSCSDLVGGPAGISTNDCSQVSEALDAVGLKYSPCGPLPSPPLCPVDNKTIVLMPVFEDNLEDLSSGNWTTAYAVGGNHWTGGAGVPDIYWTGFSTSGRWSLWGYDAPARGDSWVAMNRSVVIPPGAYLQFRHFFGFEAPNDGGLLEYSIDEGQTWLPVDGYEAIGMTPRAQVPLGRGNPLQGRSVFTGQSWGYTFSRVDLFFVGGMRARFRFRIGTDRQIGDIGWLIDDVQIYTCLLRPLPAITDASVTEGDSGTSPAVFTVSLAEPFPLSLSVNYVAGTPLGSHATPDVDYVVGEGRLDFPPGATSRTIAVPVIGDRANEFDEHFAVTISDPMDGRAVAGRGTIVDDDAQGLTISDTAVGEPRSGTVNATFDVANPADTTVVTVSYQTQDDTATSPEDYTPTSGTLVFASGETRKTITVPVKASAASLSPRTFHVEISTASGVPITRPRGTATIYEPGFYPLAPCRLLDTRESAQGPALSSGSTRIVVAGDKCAIPASASAVSLNLTVVSPTAAGDLRLFESGKPLPLVSTINYGAGQIRANNAVVPLSEKGWFSVFCAQAAGSVDLVVDVNGFFE